MQRYGFQRTEDRYVYRTDFMGGEFSAILTVTSKGEAHGIVIDRMNNEEYLQLRMERFDGAYVNTVRGAYEDVLKTVASACCTDVLFASDQANRITERIRCAYGVVPDFPWGQSPHDNSGVFRHTDSQKWFALIMNIPTKTLLKNSDPTPIDVVNLKIDPPDGPKLQEQMGIYPAYHMNHKSWITVMLNDCLSDDAVMALIETSYRLTESQPKKTRSQRKEPV